jgi:hypothetical protein
MYSALNCHIIEKTYSVLPRIAMVQCDFHWYCRVFKNLYNCYCVAIVKEIFTLKSMETIHRSTP